MSNTLSVSSFINNALTKGGLRPNRFEVTFAPPPGIAIDPAITFLCKAASLPVMTMGTAKVPYMGREINVAGDITIDPWEVTVVLDSADTRDAFLSWKEMAMGTNSNTGALSPQTYFGSITVSLVGRDGSNYNGVYNLTSVYPSVVGAVALDYGTNNTVAECQITFEINDIVRVSSTGVTVTK